MCTLIYIAIVPGRALQRVVLAIKFYTRLGYSWHLAWCKAAR